jgi:hypothetical protein
VPVKKLKPSDKHSSKNSFAFIITAPLLYNCLLK